MAATAVPAPTLTRLSADSTRVSALRVAAVASLGVGAIHAAAIGVHSEHRSAVIAFTAVAGAQLAWGALALTRAGRAVAAVGIAVQAASIGGWLLAKTVGIGFVAGLDAVENVQMADGAAAALAAVALLLAGRELVMPGKVGASSPSRRLGVTHGALAVVVAAASVTAMVSAGSHAHVESDAGGHGQGGDASASGGDDESAAGGHGGDSAEASGADDPHGTESAQADGAGDASQAHDGAPAAVVAPKPYDPSMPIDLGGVEGVTPQQQAAAENLIAITLARLPQFADPAAAEAVGFRSIGDGFTGFEHLIKWDYLSDGRTLDPDYPEALVYDTRGEGRTLVSAMFLLEAGETLETVPELGGPLTQWHIHDDLCFSTGPNPQVRGITTVGGACQPPLQKFTPVPMIHVWITRHECGPFSALEGVGAGQIQEGEERLCDVAHGG